MARKVFISFLGFSNYRECMYGKDNFCSSNVRFIQEATLDYLQTLGEWTANDVAYILLTEGAKAKNWVDNGHRNPKTNEIIKQVGLETSLKQKNYPFQIKTIEQLPDGKNEEELFDLFRRIYEVIQPGDSFYFDITHGFRSLPMLALVLINYAKFLKNIEVKSITYGNFEAREELHDADGNICLKAPIIDLLPLSGIQDWTFAAADYLKNGNAEKFKQLVTAHKTAICRGLISGNKEEAKKINDLANSLQRVTNDLQTCRGKEILETSNFMLLRKNIEEVGKAVVEPLNPIIKKLDDAFSVFSTNEEKESSYHFINGMEATKWCIQHGLYQQAATILQENVVSFFCNRHGLNIFDKDDRENVNTVFAFVKKLSSDDVKEKEKNVILKKIERDIIYKSLFEDLLLSEHHVVNAFSMLTDERNDINHSGMRSDPHSTETIRTNIYNAYNILTEHLGTRK